ncbi:MAG: hypothetical protein KF775_04385 [Cyclobacteriaceae bacterium]|nr:hypothetical protein [Cytophagales bacterium]MBX2898858.1 hypothetical protein [Cyclobacteriaceae bacterium]
METSARQFIETWDHYLILGAYACFGVAVLILIFHEIKLITIKEHKDRYDYVNLHEIKFFWYAILSVIIGLALFATAEVTPVLPVDDSLKLYVSFFFLAGSFVIVYLLLSSLIKIQYPKLLEGRLKRIRASARKSSAGNTMRKLSEEEGSVHLDAEQLAQHRSDIHSVEYDVWLDEKTGEKKVEKYLAYQHAEKCSECGFYTMKIDSEEIEKQPTQTEDGLLLEHYRCSYCKHREAKEVVIAALSSNVKGA